MYEKAVAYFERAAQIQPQEVKWKLMVASCHRRSGDYQLAFEIYRLIHADFPDNVECLRYLVHICDDLGKKDQSHDYVVKLRAVERALEGGAMETQQMAQQPPPQYAHGGRGYDENTAHNAPAGAPGYDEAYERSQVEAAAANGARGPTRKVANSAAVEDDHFADVELDDNLLPS